MKTNNDHHRGAIFATRLFMQPEKPLTQTQRAALEQAGGNMRLFLAHKNHKGAAKTSGSD
jgi:hypothetical protein